ncbi:Sterile alpha motif (SAM) domain-containing protein [Raphanus sativus]|nr:Sterile alpha motif (SAM) domain-containing protein [Raphanus sativus]
MAELQPGNDGNNQQPNGGGVPPPSLPSTSAEAQAGSKRLRRPSVRLGEIGGGGEQYQAAAYDYSQVRRAKKDMMSKSSTRTRALTNLSSGYDNNVDSSSFGVGSWRVKKRVGSSTKRVRSNWVSRIGETDQGGEEFEGGGGGFRDFSREDSESSPVKDESRGGFYGASSGNREFELLSEPAEGGRQGVKIWLQELGLGRYWPMFEIHEVDEEVLPLLTLEDLKDMGINAVGSRRKMFCAIQKLGREFS